MALTPSPGAICVTFLNNTGIDIGAREVFKMNTKKRLNLFRRYGHWKRAGCIYIHVPKAAGTSINHALYGRTLGHYTAAEIKTTFPCLFRRSFTFTFVRNPWDRALSAYRFAKQGGTSAMAIHNPSKYKVSEFDSFERFVLEWLPSQDADKLDYVFMPQWHFVTAQDAGLMLDFVGKIENMNSDILEVEKRLGRPLSVKKMNATSFEASYRDYYTDGHMVEIIRDFYKQDVMGFDYEF